MKKHAPFKLLFTAVVLLTCVVMTVSASSASSFQEKLVEMGIEGIEIEQDEFTGETTAMVEIGDLSSSSVNNVVNLYANASYNSEKNTGSFSIIVAKRNYMDRTVKSGPYYNRIIILSDGSKIDLQNPSRIQGALNWEGMKTTQFSSTVPDEESYFFVSLIDMNHIAFFDSLATSSNPLKVKVYSEFGGESEGTIEKEGSIKTLLDLFTGYKDYMGY